MEDETGTDETRIEKSFGVSAHPRLSLSNVRGSITIETHDRDEIQVTAVKRVQGCRDPDRTEIVIDQRGDLVAAETRHKQVLPWQDHKPCAVDYTVYVPASCRMSARQVEGIISITGVSGRVDVNAVQGDVHMHHLSGRTQVKVVSAKIDGTDWQGRARLETVSGAVRIAGAQLSRIEASTVSADLILDTGLEDDGRYRLNSVSGNVTFYLPPGRGVETRGSSISGRLLCELPHDFSRRGHGGWQATVNGGGPAVRFSSISGDLELLAVPEG
jgi:hypothetical protein